MRVWRCAALAATWALVVLFARTSAAQVNVERLRGDLGKAPAVGSIEGTFTGRSGNVDSVETGGVATAAARVGRNRFFASTLADYGRVNHITTVSRSFIHVRYNYELLYWLAAEVFAQQQQDKFQRLLLRELIGTGPRFVVADEKELRVALGTAYMLEYERINVAEGAPDKRATIAHRSSSYASAVWQLDDRIRMLGTVYIQPRLDDWGDVRVLAEAAVTTDLAKRFALKFAATLRHDSEPPTEVKPTDIEVKNSFVFKF